MASSPVASELAASVAAAVDAAASRRVVVLGSLPPEGRDLDLLAREGERDEIGRALRAAGLTEKGANFALFRACSAYGVDLIPAEEFLAQAAREDFFAQARPLEGARVLARPAPGHALLVLARLVADEHGLRPKRMARLQRILAEDPGAWERARELAPSWGAQRALARLERAASPPSSPRRPRLHARELALRARPRRPRRGLLVALSGIDGAGKSSQARWLASSLSALGVDVEVVWNDLLGNVALDLLATPPKLLLALLRRGGGRERMARWDDAPPAEGEAPTAGGARVAWSMIVTLANSLEQQVAASPRLAHGRVVVFDRSPLDLAVRMQVLYRAKVEWQRRLVKLAAPRPDLAFLLDIRPEISLTRKHDVWSPEQLVEQAALYRSLAPGFGVERIDGERPPEEIAAEIARAAWLALA